jgi:two-component system, cell cycle response regulator DivK
MRVLLVEDNEMNRDMLSRRLRRRGCDVALAVDGQDALAAARAAPAPDVILMDMSLPVLDGWAATRQLKADPATRAIPIIALTAHAMAGDRERALAAGCDDFETKPVDLDRVLAKMTALVERGPDAPTAVAGPALVRQAKLENLPAVVRFVEEACRERQADPESTLALKLAVEEVFTNIVHYAYPGGAGPVTLSVTPDPAGLSLSLSDEGVPFDPSLAPLPDLESSWEARPLGGLGWHLVRQLVDEVRHRPGDSGGNVVTLVKRFPVGTPDAGAS